MLLPKGGINWKAAKANLPPYRAVIVFVTRTRFLLIAAFTAAVLLLWRGISSHASEMQSFYCWGPNKSPMEMTANEQESWNARMQTPVMFNHHAPLEINSSSIAHVNLNPVQSTRKAIANEERVLILTPVKDAARYLSKYFELVSQLTYPHHLIDLAFLVSDSTDDTLADRKSVV